MISGPRAKKYLLPHSKSKVGENYKVNNIGWRCIKYVWFTLKKFDLILWHNDFFYENHLKNIILHIISCNVHKLIFKNFIGVLGTANNNVLHLKAESKGILTLLLKLDDVLRYSFIFSHSCNKELKCKFPLLSTSRGWENWIMERNGLIIINISK